MSIEKQKAVAEEVLNKLESFDPTCILAGGAPRDWFFGNEATDLDFFVYFRPDLQQWHWSNMLQKVGLKFNKKGAEDFPENYKRNPHLLVVYEGNYKGEKIQVMFMDEKTFHCVVDLFPFGICQAWWKGVGFKDYFTGSDIHTTRHFDESVKHKVLRLINDLYNDEDGYIQKIKSKFPDYLFIGR
jgi:hypothetical protein